MEASRASINSNESFINNIERISYLDNSLDYNDDYSDTNITILNIKPVSIDNEPSYCELYNSIFLTRCIYFMITGFFIVIVIMWAVNKNK